MKARARPVAAKRYRKEGRVLAVAVAAGVLLTCFRTVPAHAFEREWHLGTGVGVSNLSAAGIGWGPEVGVHGAYGISDSFDARLEARVSQHPFTFERQFEMFDERRSFLRTELVIAYKIDILRWVPWLGVGAGYFHSFEQPLPEQNLRRHDALLSGLFGVDYAVSRSFGVGLALRTALLLAGSADYGAQLRAEYRWGF